MSLNLEQKYALALKKIRWGQARLRSMRREYFIIKNEINNLKGGLPDKDRRRAEVMALAGAIWQAMPHDDTSNSHDSELCADDARHLHAAIEAELAKGAERNKP